MTLAPAADPSGLYCFFANDFFHSFPSLKYADAWLSASGESSLSRSSFWLAAASSKSAGIVQEDHSCEPPGSSLRPSFSRMSWKPCSSFGICCG